MVSLLTPVIFRETVPLSHIVHMVVFVKKKQRCKKCWERIEIKIFFMAFFFELIWEFAKAVDKFVLQENQESSMNDIFFNFPFWGQNGKGSFVKNCFLIKIWVSNMSFYVTGIIPRYVIAAIQN